MSEIILRYFPDNTLCDVEKYRVQTLTLSKTTTKECYYINHSKSLISLYYPLKSAKSIF